MILNRNGDIIPESAIRELKSAVKGEILIKGEASDEAYGAAIHRFNEGTIQEAVSIL
jgi:hypothetical protein